MRTLIYEKIEKALAELGYELKKDGDLISFEMDSVDYFVCIDEEEKNFCVFGIVLGSKDQFEMAMEVVNHFHRDYEGDWNDGKSYISSPVYSLKGFKAIPKELMNEIVNEFQEVCSFMEALVTDGTIPESFNN